MKIALIYSISLWQIKTKTTRWKNKILTQWFNAQIHIWAYNFQKLLIAYPQMCWGVYKYTYNYVVLLYHSMFVNPFKYIFCWKWTYFRFVQKFRIYLFFYNFSISKLISTKYINIIPNTLRILGCVHYIYP
jgi:hypothetical protein